MNPVDTRFINHANRNPETGTGKEVRKTDNYIAQQLWGKMLVNTLPPLSKLLSTNQNKGGEKMSKMSEWIQDNYPKTKDAILVVKWFGDQLNGGCGSQVFLHFVIKGREQELLELAKELEEKEKARRKEGYQS